MIRSTRLELCTEILSLQTYLSRKTALLEFATLDSLDALGNKWTCPKSSVRSTRISLIFLIEHRRNIICWLSWERKENRIWTYPLAFRLGHIDRRKLSSMMKAIIKLLISGAQALLLQNSSCFMSNNLKERRLHNMSTFSNRKIVSHYLRQKTRWLMIRCCLLLRDTSSNPSLRLRESWTL